MKSGCVTVAVLLFTKNWKWHPHSIWIVNTKIFSDFMDILAVAARADTSSVRVKFFAEQQCRPVDACPASSWCRATSGPCCWCWPPPWCRCSSWPRPAAASTASPSSTRLPPTSKCPGRARPGCGALSCRIGKCRSLFPELKDANDSDSILNRLGLALCLIQDKSSLYL